MYFVEKNVVGVVPAADGTATVASEIFLGHRMQDLLLKEKDLLEALGFVDQEAIYNSLDEGAARPTFIELFSANDAYRIGLLRQFSI